MPCGVPPSGQPAGEGESSRARCESFGHLECGLWLWGQELQAGTLEFNSKVAVSLFCPLTAQGTPLPPAQTALPQEYALYVQVPGRLLLT